MQYLSPAKIMDSLGQFYDDLLDFPVAKNPEMNLKYDNVGRQVWDGHLWPVYFINAWPLVWVALGFYVLLISVGPVVMARRDRIFNKKYLCVWNSFLALFSISGFAAIFPKILFSPDAGILTVGFKESLCAHPSWYGHGYSGFFVMLFIASKIAEFGDTVFLVLGKRPLIVLHWYHHITVLLFCWHSYSKSSTMGVYFAVINYGVHSIMYTYYALTQLGYKKQLADIAPYITIFQTSQMAFGVLIILSNMYYGHIDDTCYYDYTNSIMGLIMYASYFVLFAKLFYERFGSSSKRRLKKKTQ